MTYTDYNRGDSQGSLGPGTGAAWGLPVDLDRQSWTLGYAGRWGALITRLDGREIGRGAQGPVGPAWQTEKWQSPVDWAQSPWLSRYDPERSPGREPPPAVAVTPAPTSGASAATSRSFSGGVRTAILR